MKNPYMSAAFSAKNSLIILDVQNTDIRIGMLDIDDSSIKSRLQKYFSGYTINFTSIEKEEFSLLLSRLFAQSDTTNTAPASKITSTERTSGDYAIDEIGDDAPVINLLNTILLEGLQKNCSDIHISSGVMQSRVRLRIDGQLHTLLHISNEQSASLSVRLKMLASLNVLEKRKPQDGRLDLQSGGEPLDIRLSIVPSIHGESIVLRILNKKTKAFNLCTLGFSDTHLALIQKLLTVPSGLILLTGPTGSGKTTTLSTFLQELNHDEVHIISIEDPVEYRIDGITQIQTDEDIGLNFDTLLRRVFRQDPDIIMIGEIRDSQTAELAIRTALTGHLVFATLHTNSSADAPIRLQDMGIPPYLLAAVLKAVISQRLVRRLSSSKEQTYSGRLLLAEILPIDDKVQNLIAQGTNRKELESHMKKKKLPLMREDAQQKIEALFTDISEVTRELGQNNE